MTEASAKKPIKVVSKTFALANEDRERPILAAVQDRQIEDIDFSNPDLFLEAFEKLNYFTDSYMASQISLFLQTDMTGVRALLLEGPSGAGKSYLAKTLAKVLSADLFVVSCYQGMTPQHLIEIPSPVGIATAMAKPGQVRPEDVVHLGTVSKAYINSRTKRTILLIDEIDKVDNSVDNLFLAPIQDGVVYPQSTEPIHAKRENLIIIFTKNFERVLSEALMRRLHPIKMRHLDASLEKKVLAPHCHPIVARNLIKLADIMRYSDGSYPFERPPAPEELLRSARHIMQLLAWKKTDFEFVGRTVWYMLAKSEHDRYVLELLLRFHPDFFDPLFPDARKMTQDQVQARLGRFLLEGLVIDPDDAKRTKAYKPEKVGLTSVGKPEDVARKLKEVGYECLPFVATQVSLLLSNKSDRVRSLLLEGPSGCGKSFFAKSLAKITGAEFICLSCYEDMNIQHLIEAPSTLAIAQASAGGGSNAKDKLMSLGVITRAFQKSQNQPVVLLVDEIDKTHSAIDTFFLGPLQDGRIWLESRPPIDCVIDNIIIVFTKNFARPLNEALLRRIHPIRMTYLNSTLERNVLSKQCFPQLVANLVSIADRMRESGGSYQFERPPAPEELLTAGQYVTTLLEWGNADFGWIGRNVWAILAKSEHDRAVLDHMMRYHPDFFDPLVPDSRNATTEEIQARLGRIVLKDIVADDKEEKREMAWKDLEYT